MSFLAESSVGRSVLLSILFVIPFITVISLLVRLLYNFVFSNDGKSLIRVQVVSVICILSFSITLFCYYFAEMFTYNVFWTALPYAMVSLFWGHGNAATYLLFMFRMKRIFGQTTYRSSNLIYAILYSMIAFVYLCQIYIVIFLICVLEQCTNPTVAFRHINIANAIEIIFQLILSITLIIIFCRKLLSITQDCVNDTLSTKFTYLATKITVLSGFGGSTTVLWLLCAAIMDIDWVAYPNSDIQLNTDYIF